VKNKKRRKLKRKRKTMDRYVTIVTGCAGFIGSHLCRRLLKEGHTVYGIDDLSVGFMSNMEDFFNDDNFEFAKYDISLLRAVNDLLTSIKVLSNSIDFVYHLAARGEVYYCREQPTEAVRVNINGTINMLALAEKLNCKRFIFADTSAEYDNVPNIKHLGISNYPSKEHISPNNYPPIGTYSISKMAASQFVRSWTQRTGIAHTIVRPFNVYGPSLNVDRDIPPVIGGFANKILKGEQPIIYGDGQKRRDFIYISDVMELFMKFITVEQNESDTYNMGTGLNYSIYEIYEFVSAAVFDKEDDWLEIDYKPEQPQEADITLADITKTDLVFEWRPKVEIEEGIKLTVESMRS
jgi:nucleoside-diphosphate-sugar epimerase